MASQNIASHCCPLSDALDFNTFLLLPPPSLDASLAALSQAWGRSVHSPFCYLSQNLVGSSYPHMLGLITHSWAGFKSPANCLPLCRGVRPNCLKHKDCIFINLDVEAIIVSLCVYFPVSEATPLLLQWSLFRSSDFMFQLPFLSVWYWRKSFVEVILEENCCHHCKFKQQYDWFLNSREECQKPYFIVGTEMQ